jgi:hypothetical protein
LVLGTLEEGPAAEHERTVFELVPTNPAAARVVVDPLEGDVDPGGFEEVVVHRDKHDASPGAVNIPLQHAPVRLATSISSSRTESGD